MTKSSNLQVFSLAAGILSEEMLNILPGVINFTLHNFSTSNKIKYRKVGEHRVFLGPIDRLLRAGDKLMEVCEMISFFVLSLFVLNYHIIQDYNIVQYIHKYSTLLDN